MTYRILDLFCGAGGAGEGYRRAGFEVVGVDIAPQPRYPFEFAQADAVDFLSVFARRRGPSRASIGVNGQWLTIDAIHASPPCQDYSATKHMRGGRTNYPRLIEPVRVLLNCIGLPYVIENVELARPEMRDPVKLCGSMFDLTAPWRGETVYLQRHRLFETSFPVPQPECDHSIGVRAVTVAGHGRPDLDNARGEYFAGKGYAALTREVMDIDWMNRDELNESIPPAYTEYVGRQLMAYLSTSNQKEAA